MNGKWPGALTAEIIESISDEEFWRYARELALLTPTKTSPAEYLRCELSCGRYLIPMTSLYEVIPPPHHFALLPATPAWMSGIFAWHPETIAVVDLDAYLSANQSQAGNDPEGTLLIARYSGLAVGLLVPTTGLATTAEPVSEHEESGSFILDIPVMLMDIVQQIRDNCRYE
jgi:CheW-like domain